LPEASRGEGGAAFQHLSAARRKAGPPCCVVHLWHGDGFTVIPLKDESMHGDAAAIVIAIIGRSHRLASL